ncbi:MAG: hypothetical protein OES79_03995 [Planctomycetota bacterium]|nr:hypothetical protein [Planctomycetota bacterium]
MDMRLRGVSPDHPTTAVLQGPAGDFSVGSKRQVRDCDWLPQRVFRSLRCLLEAHRYANDLGSDDWEFAIQMTALRAEGLTEMDVRWMVQADLVDFAYEVSLPGEPKRQFRRTENLVYSETLCLILSRTGIEDVTAWLRSQPLPGPCSDPEVVRLGVAAQPPTIHRIPHWDRDRQELRVGEVVVKRFKAPAANQETILAVFDEEGWPPRIDDPLSPCPDLEPKRRLHDTINSLNRNQKTRLLRFFGDGSGTGIRWEFVGESEPGD